MISIVNPSSPLPPPALPQRVSFFLLVTYTRRHIHRTSEHKISERTSMLVGSGSQSILAPLDHKREPVFFLDREMDNHWLTTWLQLHLATDDSAVTNLHFILNSLTGQDSLSQGQVQKWTIRINSPIHSKDPEARWAGFSIALRTATFSKDSLN